jgi:hypothetical protein
VLQLNWSARTLHFSIAAVAALSGWLANTTSASAAGKCTMTYETFESAIAHLDAEKCPDASDGDKVFCRISVGGDRAHVFYFSDEGAQCLLKVESFDDDEVEIRFNKD